jgi:photosystem II stability/assembly factor-like uncharacterized protein
MRFYERAGALVSLIALTAAVSSCNGATNKGSDQLAAKPGHWIAQFRSPHSAKIAGVNLAAFSYSSISVVSKDVVFVAGDMPDPRNIDERIAVVVHTVDGGKSWAEHLIEQPGIKIPTLNSVSFVSPQVGWVVGADSAQLGIMLKTTDGGSTWTMSRIDAPQVPTVVVFADERNGWMGGVTPLPEDPDSEGGPSDILSRTDGGNTWQHQRRIPTSISDMCFLDKNEGWAVGYKGAIYHTADGGFSWNAQKSELESGEGPPAIVGERAKAFYLTGVHFIDKQTGIVSGKAKELDEGIVLATENGGTTWLRRRGVPDSGVRAVHMVSPTAAFAVIDYGHYIDYTADGGRTWLSEPVQFVQDVPFFKIGSAGPSDVWAVGGGAIFHRETN